MSRAAETAGGEEERCRYKGVRRRRWGKWVSEIRVPGTRERLWLGSYATPEAAAVAHDTAVYFLRGGGDDGSALNFPGRAAAAYGAGAGSGAGARLSPRSVQRVASDAGMATDAQLVAARESAPIPRRADADRTCELEHDTYAYTYIAGGNTSRSTSTSREQPVSGEISVDEIEILM